MPHLFEDLTHSEETLRKRPLQEKRNALLFLEKSFPFLGRLNGGEKVYHLEDFLGFILETIP